MFGFKGFNLRWAKDLETLSQQRAYKKAGYIFKNNNLIAWLDSVESKSPWKPGRKIS